jgi:hypothetical protein
VKIDVRFDVRFDVRKNNRWYAAILGGVLVLLTAIGTGRAASPNAAGPNMNTGLNQGLDLGLDPGLDLGLDLGLAPGLDPGLDQAAAIRHVDEAVLARVSKLAGYTATERYAVFRGKDETHPVADMTVKTTYRRETGKSYQVLSQNGSALIRRLGLDPLLDREKTINLPGNVEHSWIDSANYDMTLNPEMQMLDGRECLKFAIVPKQKAPNLIIGSVWVDAKDYTIVKLEGVASKSPSVFAGTTHMLRQYARVDGFAMATHAWAESSTFLYGRTVVTIDYTGYRIEAKPGM